MELLSKEKIKNLLKGRPSKKLGQNFLIDKEVLSEILDVIKIEGDSVLEIGPGLGALTSGLAEKAEEVVAVEKDPKMCRILKNLLPEVRVLNQDILKTDIENIFPGKYKVVANIPYYLTSPLIRKLLEAANPPEDIFLMVQKEVAERITAEPPKMSVLALSVQFYSDPEILFEVPSSAFWPEPEIGSSFLRIRPSLKYNADGKSFFEVVKAGFSQPRKQLANNLSKELELNKDNVKEKLSKRGVDSKARAETLSLNDWIRITEEFS